VELFYGVEVRAFFVVLQYLHDIMDGTERVCFFKEVLCEAGGGWIVFVEGTFVLFVALGKLSVCPT
jgi:hypothetical protein